MVTFPPPAPQISPSGVAEIVPELLREPPLLSVIGFATMTPEFIWSRLELPDTEIGRIRGSCHQSEGGGASECSDVRRNLDCIYRCGVKANTDIVCSGRYGASIPISGNEPIFRGQQRGKQKIVGSVVALRRAKAPKPRQFAYPGSRREQK